MSTMTILEQRTSFPGGPKYAVAKNLCFVVLVWVCLLGHEFSVAAAAAAQQTAKSHPGSRAVYRLSAVDDEWSVEAGAQPTALSYTVNTTTARRIARSSKSSKVVGELSVAAAAKPIASPIARRKTGPKSINRVAARRTARSHTGSSALDKLPTAAVQAIVRSNSESRDATHHDSAFGIPTPVPTIGNLGPSKITAAWQVPKGPIKKVLVIFEDVSVLPYEFWDRSPNCPQCTGLPEKRKIVMDAIARNYAVLIPHPLDIDRMWESQKGSWKGFLPNSPDFLNILYSLAEWKSGIGVRDNVPTVALGVSSGGEILSTLGLLPGYFESIGMMISPGLSEAFKSCTRDYPPTIFIHMPKDTATAEKVFYDRKLLSANGVPTKEVRWYEHSVTQYWFAELIPGLDQKMSSEIHRRLKQLQWLDSKTGFLTQDSNFQKEWFKKVREWNLFPTDLTEEEELMIEDRVFEELNVAYAYHATIARNNKDVFAWFEGGYEVQERILNSPPASVSLSKAASYSPAPVSRFKVASYKPAPVSRLKVASYKPATVSLFKAASY